MAKKKAKRKATKSSARKKSLKLRKKPLRDLTAKKKSTKVKGGVDMSLSPSQQAALKIQRPQLPSTFAPPYVPVQPGLLNPRPS